MEPIEILYGILSIIAMFALCGVAAFGVWLFWSDIDFLATWFATFGIFMLFMFTISIGGPPFR